MAETMTQTERLTLYKLLVEQANVIAVARRETNRFFLTFNTAVFGAIGLFYAQRITAPLLMLLAAALGMALVCTLWSALITYYGRIAGAKFQVIFEVEKHFELQPFQLEQQNMHGGPAWTLSASRIESIMPLIFALAYAGVAVHAAIRMLSGA